MSLLKAGVWKTVVCVLLLLAVLLSVMEISVLWYRIYPMVTKNDFIRGQSNNIVQRHIGAAVMHFPEPPVPDVFNYPTCERNRNQENKLSYESLVTCLFFNCESDLYKRQCTNKSCKHASEKLCRKTTVERCSEYVPPTSLAASDACFEQHRRDHRLVSVAESLNIFIGVRTSASSHESRVSLILLTWMLALHDPKQVHIVTNSMENDIWMDMAAKFGFVVKTDSGCPADHGRESLCCKVGTEADLYYQAVESGHDYRWFCFLDDDIYVNVPSLVKEFQQYDPLNNKVYLGHYPDSWGPHKVDPTILAKLNTSKFLLKKKYVTYGLGASNCLSAALMRELEPFIRGGNTYAKMCQDLKLPDDVTMGVLVESHLGYKVMNRATILTHIEDLRNYRGTKDLEKLITFGYKYGNHLNSARLLIPETVDPTRFLSFHCLMFPEVSWCQHFI